MTPKRDFLAVTDLTRDELLGLIDLASRMKSGAYRERPLAGKAKDVAAGAVLLSAIGSVVIGVLVIGHFPHSYRVAHPLAAIRYLDNLDQAA